MERDPARLVWNAAPVACGVLVLLAVLAGLPLVLAALDLTRIAIEAATATARQPSVWLFRWTVTLPDRISEVPVVVWPGVEVARRSLFTALAASLGGIIAAAALLWWMAGLLASRIGKSVHAALIDRIGNGIASAPAVASDEARMAASLAGEALDADRRAFGLMPAIPALAGATLVASTVWIALRDVWTAGVLLVALAAFAVVARRLQGWKRDLAVAERRVSTSFRRALSDLAENLSAVNRHGTQLSEQGRIVAEMRPSERAAARLENRVSAGAALATLLLLASPASVLAATLWAAAVHGVSAGEVAAATVAASLSAAALVAHARGRRAADRIQPVFAELARLLGGFQSRRRTHDGTDPPTEGEVEATDLATGPGPTGRLSGATLAFALPGHVALTGPRDAGARAFAAVLGGQVRPVRGALTINGRDLAEAGPAWRADRFAFAGGDTYLFRGTLRANLLYGSPGSQDAKDRLSDAITAAGLDDMVERRGLEGKVEPRREPALAERLVEARRALRASLDEAGLSRLVEPFDPDAYNPQATIAENILFGAALGDTFREDRLPSQPFVRSLLDADGLAKPLAAMGAEIARATIEMFADLDDDASLLGSYSIVSLSERDELERVLRRREAKQRGTASGRDAERLVGIALRYCERRHRLGLLDADLEVKVVKLRKDFAAKLPKSLDPAVEFFRADRVCAAASVRDNLLFGRVADDEADADREVGRHVRRVIEHFELDPEITRIGLLSRLDPVDPGMSEAELAAVEVVRCLVRKPDVLIVEHALAHLSEGGALEGARRLRGAMAGRGLVVAVPESVARNGGSLYDRVVRFEAGRAVDGEVPDRAPARAAE